MAEGSCLIVLDPVLDGRLEEPAACLELLERLEPCVEASRLRRVNEAGDEVGDDLVALREQLRLQMMLRAVVDLYLPVQLHDLGLMCSLAPLQFAYVLVVDISTRCVVRTLPVVEGVIRDQTVNADDRSDQEGLALLEALDSVDPGVENVCIELLTLDAYEPIHLVRDEGLALDILDLQLVLLEGIPQASPLNGLGRFPQPII